MVSRLEAALVIDDLRFATEFTRDKRTISAWGRTRIAATLSRRGISSDLIEVALEADDGSDVDRAVELLGTRSYRLDIPSERQRALGLLGRRGFTAEDSYEALRRAARAEGLEVPDSE